MSSGCLTILQKNGSELRVRYHTVSRVAPAKILRRVPVFFQVYRANLVPCDECQRQLLCPLVTGNDSNIHSIFSSSSASTLSDSLAAQLNFVWLCRFVTIDSCILSCAFAFSRQLSVVRLVRIAFECHFGVIILRRVLRVSQWCTWGHTGRFVLWRNLHLTPVETDVKS